MSDNLGSALTLSVPSSGRSGSTIDLNKVDMTKHVETEAWLSIGVGVEKVIAVYQFSDFALAARAGFVIWMES